MRRNFIIWGCIKRQIHSTNTQLILVLCNIKCDFSGFLKYRVIFYATCESVTVLALLGIVNLLLVTLNNPYYDYIVAYT